MDNKSCDYSAECWPKGSHYLLLQAALFDGAAAITAWEQWFAGIDLDKLDYASYQIIPKLYKNLTRLHVKNPAMGIFKGIYRHTWVENQRMLYLYSSLVNTLRSAGIDQIVLLKGGAMALGYYRDPGIRPMGDLDILVPKEMAVKTIQQLMLCGFQPDPAQDINALSLASKIEMQHGMNMTGEISYGKLNIDVHWNLLPDIASRHFNNAWLDDAVDILLHGEHVQILNPTHLLFQTCVHGTKYSPVPLIRWVMDAVTLIETRYDDINWDDIVKQAVTNELVQPVRAAFEYLRKYFHAPIPLTIINQLAQAHVAFVKKLEFRAKQQKMPGLAAAASFLWCQHSRQQLHKAFFMRLITFPDFLRKYWGVGHLWQFSYYLPVKVMKAVKKRIFIN